MGNNCGIYKITNIENGKVYIGSSTNLRKRLYLHRYTLNNKIHDNSYLQRAWDKYGEEKFEFSILELVLDVNILMEREQFWLNKYLSFKREFGYNLLPIAGNSMGYKHTEDTKKLLSTKILSEKTKHKISESKKGKKATNETRKKMSELRIGDKHPFWGKQHQEYSKKRMSNSHNFMWEVVSPNGETFVIKGLKDFCMKNGLNASWMSQVALGKCKSHKGWICRKMEGDLDGT